MTQLLNAEIEDDGGVRKLTRTEVLTYTGMVAGAGNETTVRLIGFACQLLADHPDQRREFVADPELIPGAIEEVLRFEAPSPVQARYVAHDTECLGEPIAEGSIMLLLNGSANRDEARFPDGERFDIHRQRRTPQLRTGSALLPRYLASTHASQGRARRASQAVAGVGRRLRGRDQGTHRQRAGVVQAADHDTMNVTAGEG